MPEDQDEEGDVHVSRGENQGPGVLPLDAATAARERFVLPTDGALRPTKSFQVEAVSLEIAAAPQKL